MLESLLFSARLRQSYAVPDEEKVRYVYSIMDLLELTNLQHAIVGSESFFNDCLFTRGDH